MSAAVPIRRFLAALLAILAFAAAVPSAGRAAFGPGGTAAVLWVPDQSSVDWAQFAAAFRAAGSPPMTVAVAPSALSAADQAVLKSLAQSGRLELALRISGDPILPLIASNAQAPRPQDALNRLALARQNFSAAFGVKPEGFSPGGGAVSPDEFSAFNAMGLSWAACGDYRAGQTTSWVRASGVLLAPLESLNAAQAQGLISSFAPEGAFVLDAADGLIPPGTMTALLSQAAADGSRLSWSTISQAAAAQAQTAAPAASISSWPTWAGDFSLWDSSGPAQQAWALYGRAAAEIARYQNSGTADLKSLEEATQALYAAQDSQVYRLIASSAPAAAAAADQKLRQALMTVYDKIDETPPDSLYRPLLYPGVAVSSQAAASLADLSPDVHVSVGPDWLSFENPAATLSRPPALPEASTAPVAASSAPASEYPLSGAAWKILGFRVNWSTASVTFSYQMAALDSDVSPETPLGRVMLDTYIDVNHVAGAGSTELLPGRRAYSRVNDAWEYALTLSSKGAFLFRSAVGGPPQQVAQFSVAMDTQDDRASLSVPRSLLSGSPRRWGYIVASMAPNPTSESLPPAPLAGPDGRVILCLLSPLGRQREFLENPGLYRIRALRGPN